MMIVSITLAALVGWKANAQMWLNVGGVFCDANNNGVLDIDSGDVPVPGVLVVVTNTSGTYSNANWTTFPDGIFVVDLPAAPGTSVDFIHPLTLPPGSIEVLPAFNTFATTPGQTIATNYFLIRNPNCIRTNTCRLSGGGTIRSGRGQPTFSFGARVDTGSGSTKAARGDLNVVWHAEKLRFKADEVAVTACGTVPDTVGLPVNYVDFEGVGALKGKGSRDEDSGALRFTARALAAGEAGSGLYLRVYNDAGQTLLLISGNPSNPTEVSPVTVSTGGFEIGDSECDD